ncbi:MAG: response regulator [Flexilinea sp.]
MLKIFLVEDEIVVRQGIKNKVNWSEHDLEFVGEASDGELAYPMIQNLKPDIIITDIKMPFMDGLALSRLVKQEMPWVKIVILSGYDEFQYAKEAISIGVTDYLLKPICSAKILETILQIKKNVEEERAQQSMSRQYKLDMQENENFQKKKFFTQLVDNTLSVSELLQRAKKLDIELSAQSYNIILFKCYQNEEEIREQYSEIMIQMENQIQKSFSVRNHMILFHRPLEGWAILIKGSDHEPASAVTRRCIKELETMFNGDQNLDYFIGSGMPVQRLQQIYKSFDEASRAFAYRYIIGKNQVVFYDEIAKAPITQNSGLSLKTLDTSKIDKTIIDRFLKSGLRENVAHFVDDYFESVGREHINSLMFRQYIAMDIHISAASFLEDIGIGKKELIERCGDLDQIAADLSSLEKTKTNIKRILEETLLLRDQSTNQKYRGLLQDAENYIHENFNSEDLSLNLVAQSVNVSPTHFSTIFSQEKGITFIEYLTTVRMGKAKELLRCSSMKSSEIGYAVGYKDPHYFSYIFKKIQGCTPKEYRAGKSDGG